MYGLTYIETSAILQELIAFCTLHVRAAKLIPASKTQDAGSSTVGGISLRPLVSSDLDDIPQPASRECVMITLSCNVRFFLVFFSYNTGLYTIVDCPCWICQMLPNLARDRPIYGLIKIHHEIDMTVLTVKGASVQFIFGTLE